MGFFKELSRYLVKYGEIAINKTEILAQLAKVKIEIKKREMEIEKVKIEIGEYVINQFEKKESISDDVIRFNIDSMNSFKHGIDEMRIKYDNIKTKLWETGTANKDGEQPE
jgi:hypothetical protein